MECELNIDSQSHSNLDISGIQHEGINYSTYCDVPNLSNVNGNLCLGLNQAGGSISEDDEPIAKLINDSRDYGSCNGSFAVNDMHTKSNGTFIVPEEHASLQSDLTTTCINHSNGSIRMVKDSEDVIGSHMEDMDDQERDQDETSKAQCDSAFPSPSLTPEDNDMEEEPIYKTSRLLRKQSAVLSKTACDERDERAAEYKKLATTLQKPDSDRTADEKVLVSRRPETVQLILARKRKRDARKRREVEFEDAADELDRKCAILAQAIAQSRHLVVYTGAGISTSAKIPDYRGSNGIWTRLQQGKDIGNHDLSLAEPTYTHMALYELYRQNILKYVVSQNCDGLHLRSGLPRNALSEVHGNMYVEVCKTCKPIREYWRLFDVTEHTGRYTHKTMRRCYTCNGALEDTIVHFGERGKLQWPLNWAGASKNARSATTILCLGSSLKVLKKYPWLWQMDKPAKRRPNLYIVNLQWTPKDECANVKIHGKCDEVMRRVMRMLGIDVPDYDRDADPIFTHGTPLCSEEIHTTTQPLLTLPTKKDIVDDKSESEQTREDVFPYGLTTAEDSQDEDMTVLEQKRNLINSDLKHKTQTERKQLINEQNVDRNCINIEDNVTENKNRLSDSCYNDQTEFKCKYSSGVKNEMDQNNEIKVNADFQMDEYNSTLCENKQVKQELIEIKLNGSDNPIDLKLCETDLYKKINKVDKLNDSDSKINYLEMNLNELNYTKLNAADSELNTDKRHLIKSVPKEETNCQFKIDNTNSIETVEKNYSNLSQTEESNHSISTHTDDDSKLNSPNPKFNDPNEVILPTFTIESFLAARPNLLFNQALLNYCTLVPSMDTTQQYCISPMMSNAGGNGGGYADLLFYPIHTNLLYSGLHSIISPPPQMLHSDMDDLPQDLSTHKHAPATPPITPPSPERDPLFAASPIAACTYCREHCEAYTCQFYDRYEPTFVNQRYRITTRSLRRPLYCMCCDVSSDEGGNVDDVTAETDKEEEEAGRVSDGDSDSVRTHNGDKEATRDVEKLHKIQAGWFGKGYKKYRRCKRRYPSY